MNTKTSNKTVLNLKIDKKTKEDAQKLAKDMGLNLSLIVNASLKQFLDKKEVIFSKTYTMTPYLERMVKEAQEEHDAGQSIGPFHTAKEAIKYLNS